MADSSEKRILNELYSNSDRARKRIARAVELSEPSLSKKIGLLQQDGLLKNFTINIDYDKAGYNTNSVTLVRMHDQHKDQQNSLVEKLSQVNEAIEVYKILGSWDIYVRWLCSSNAQVMNLVENIISTHESVAHTETITLGQEYKRERGPSLK